MTSPDDAPVPATKHVSAASPTPFFSDEADAAAEQTLMTSAAPMPDGVIEESEVAIAATPHDARMPAAAASVAGAPAAAASIAEASSAPASVPAASVPAASAPAARRIPELFAAWVLAFIVVTGGIAAFTTAVGSVPAGVSPTPLSEAVPAVDPAAEGASAEEATTGEATAPEPAATTPVEAAATTPQAGPTTPFPSTPLGSEPANRGAGAPPMIVVPAPTAEPDFDIPSSSP